MGIDWKQSEAITFLLFLHSGAMHLLCSHGFGLYQPSIGNGQYDPFTGMNTIQSLDGKVANLNAGSQLNEVVVVGYGDTDSETSGSSADP